MVLELAHPRDQNGPGNLVSTIEFSTNEMVSTIE
jgi:hypothetical protein